MGVMREYYEALESICAELHVDMDDMDVTPKDVERACLAAIGELVDQRAEADSKLSELQAVVDGVLDHFGRHALAMGRCGRKNIVGLAELFVDAISEAEAENTQLQAVVDKLPKTLWSRDDMINLARDVVTLRGMKLSEPDDYAQNVGDIADILCLAYADRLLAEYPEVAKEKK